MSGERRESVESRSSATISWSKSGTYARAVGIEPKSGDVPVAGPVAFSSNERLREPADANKEIRVTNLVEAGWPFTNDHGRIHNAAVERIK